MFWLFGRLFGLSGISMWLATAVAYTAIAGGIYLYGRNDGYSACELARLAADLRQAKADIAATDDWLDFNARAAAENAKVEAKNVQLSERMRTETDAAGADDVCASSGYLQFLRSFE